VTKQLDTTGTAGRIGGRQYDGSRGYGSLGSTSDSEGPLRGPVELSYTPPLTDHEKKVIELIRDTGYGDVNVKVKDGKPVLAYVTKTLKLD
jgi:hypothetical protein